MAGGRRGKRESRMEVFQERRWESVMVMPFVVDVRVFRDLTCDVGNWLWKGVVF